MSVGDPVTLQNEQNAWMTSVPFELKRTARRVLIVARSFLSCFNTPDIKSAHVSQVNTHLAFEKNEQKKNDLLFP